MSVVQTKEREKVIEILEYLLSQRVLKKEYIEGMDAHFPVLERMIEDCMKVKMNEWKGWFIYWSRGIHRNHITKFPDNRDIGNCSNEFCLSAQRTLRDLEP